MAQISGIHVGDAGSTYDVDTNAGDLTDETQRIVAAGSSSSAVTSVSATTSSTQLKASNGSRGGLSVFNDSTATLYVKMGATASTTSFTTKVGPQVLWEMPAGRLIYTGTVDGIWDSATGSARVTEW